ncbi:VOC family protein [Solimonas variicoloris]|uniref:VOC family protein n=1 Tax=Solimonas variicoloris TaxID=254408 RepID=UPI000382679E|nr:VOC family protein [Solimonas variicoloris]
MKIQPYLTFDGRCEEAIEFYRRAVGAETTVLLRFKDQPEAAQGMPPALHDKIMHCSLRIGQTEVMATDGHCRGTPQFAGISLALSVPDASAALRVFAALSDGGRVVQALTKTFFSPSFGVLADRFGVEWMIVAAP